MMRAEFSLAVDPIFEQVLSTIAELDFGSELDPAAVRAELLNLFDRAEAMLGPTTQWNLARYALAAWIDEVLLGTPWDGARWWRDNILEMELFQSRICSVRFFELARQASAEPVRDALEVFVNCVQLGFRGMYGETPAELMNTPGTNTHWPTTIAAWLKQMEPRLDVTGRQQQNHVVAHYPQRQISGAPPLPAARSVVWWSLAAVVLLLANGWAFQGLAFHLVTGK